MLQKLNWMLINEIENEITNVLLRSDVYSEFVCHFVKLVALSTKLSARKRNWSLENEVEFLKMKLSERKWNRMPENEITCIFFEIDTGISTSNQFRCEIESPFTNLNDISTKLAGKTYTFACAFFTVIFSNCLSDTLLLTQKKIKSTLSFSR